MQEWQAVPTLFCSRRFRMILTRLWMRFISVQKTEKDLRFLQLQKVQSPKTMHSLPRSSTRQKLHPAGIHRFLMRLQIRFRRNAVWKSALRFRATHSVEEVRAHTTEYYVPVLDLPLPKQLWMENLAAWSPWSTTRPNVCRLERWQAS